MSQTQIQAQTALRRQVQEAVIEALLLEQDEGIVYADERTARVIADLVVKKITS